MSNISAYQEGYTDGFDDAKQKCQAALEKSTNKALQSKQIIFIDNELPACCGTCKYFYYDETSEPCCKCIDFNEWRREST